MDWEHKRTCLTNFYDAYPGCGHKHSDAFFCKLKLEGYLSQIKLDNSQNPKAVAISLETNILDCILNY